MIGMVRTDSGGPVALLMVLLVLVATVLPAWAIGHAVGTRRFTFSALGRSKAWVTWLVLLFVFGDFAGFLLAIYYLTKVRPQLNELETAQAVSTPRRHGTEAAARPRR